MSKDSFGYELPVEPDRHSLLLQGSRGGTYTGEPFSLAQIKGIASFSVRQRGRTTTIKIVSDDAAIWQRDWKMTADWHRHWSKPNEPKAPKHPRRAPKAKASPR
jgi:hypothetical protein